MERDPVCGMTVDPERAAAKAEHAGKTYYFCSKGCAEQFRADPERYLKSATPAPAPPVRLGGVKSARPATPSSPSVGSVFLCPMDPEVRQDHPGSCPKCGMALEPEVPAAPATRIEYTCPMHPQIVRPGPGSCPICGMALEPRTVSLGDEENPELRDMRRRFWISSALSIPVLVITMADSLPGHPLEILASNRAQATF